MKAVKDNVNLYDVKSTQRVRVTTENWPRSYALLFLSPRCHNNHWHIVILSLLFSLLICTQMLYQLIFDSWHSFLLLFLLQKRRTYKHSMQPPAFITPGTITPPIKLSASYLPPSGTSLKLPTTSTNTSMALKSPLPAPTSPSSSSCQQYTQTAHVVEGIPVTCDAMKFSYQLCTTPSTISLPQRALTSRDHLPSLSGLHFIAPAFSGNLDTKHTTLQPQVYPNTLFNFAPPTTYVLSSPYQQALALRE